MPVKKTIILGPPGTGKTTKLISIMEEEMSKGVSPDRIAFVSFTRKAADEAKKRAIAKFGFSSSDLPHFRTFHSMAFKALGVSRSNVFGYKNKAEVANHLGLKFRSGHVEDGGIPGELFSGDRFAFLDGFSRARCITPEKAWRDLADDELNWWEFHRYLGVLKDYKKERGLWEFQDMIDEFCRQEIMIDIDVAIIDEAQDLSTSQWLMADCAFRNCKRVYVGGDDDQAIFQWSGADVSKFLSLEGEVIALNKSHRLPQKIWGFADHLARTIGQRFPKEWEGRNEAGFLDYHGCLDSVDLVEGDWLLLARNTHQLKELVALARERGVPYTYKGENTIDTDHVSAIKAWEVRRAGKTPSYQEEVLIKRFARGNPDPLLIWHEALVGIPTEDRIYYTSLLRRKESLTKPPRIHINTIHGVKGGEADNVLLMTDMTDRTFQGMQTNYDAEARVFYVGATRAKHRLEIIMPQTRRFFDV